jgi:hypothetical protein
MRNNSLHTDRACNLQYKLPRETIYLKDQQDSISEVVKVSVKDIQKQNWLKLIINGAFFVNTKHTIGTKKKKTQSWKMLTILSPNFLTRPSNSGSKWNVIRQIITRFVKMFTRNIELLCCTCATVP